MDTGNDAEAGRSGRGGMWDPSFPVRPERCRVFYGWVVVALSTLGICASMPGQTIGVSVFTSRLSEAMGLSSMQLSTAYMLGTFLSALWLGAGGRFFDRVGARKSLVFSVVAMGVVLLGLGAVEAAVPWVRAVPLMDFRPWLAAFVLLTLGFALLRFTGQGMLTLSSRAMLGKWFDRRRGAVTAWSGAVVSLFMSATPLMLESLIRSVGWQGAWQLLGVVLLLGVAVVFWAFARDNPEECGLEMDGGAVAETRARNEDAVIYRDYTRAEACRTFSFWAFTLTMGLSGMVLTAYTFHVLEISGELGVSSDFVLRLFVPTAVVSVVSGFAVAWLTDQPFVRVKYLLCVMAVTLQLGFSAVALGAYPAVSWLHVLGFGVSGGCFSSLSAIIWPRFFGRTHLGAISGLFMTVLVLTSAVGPFLFSLAEWAFGLYRSGFIFAALAAAALGVAALRADNPQRREVADQDA